MPLSPKTLYATTTQWFHTMFITILDLAQNVYYHFKFTYTDWQKDRNFVLAAVQRYGCALAFAHKNLRKNRHIVLAAVQNYGYALRFAHKNLRRDRHIVLAALQNNLDAHQFVQVNF